MVVTRGVHRCGICGEVIPEGSKVLTVNPKRLGRKWICSYCKGLVDDVDSCKGRLDSALFDDEGGILASMDAYSSAVDALYSRCEDKDFAEVLCNV